MADVDTNLNLVTIAAPSETPNGTQIAVKGTTVATATLIAVAPAGADWAEFTIEACNISPTVDYTLKLLWGGTDVSCFVVQKLTQLTGVSIIVEGRLLRGGLKIMAFCTDAPGTGPGVADILNVYVRPPLLHKAVEK